MIFLLFLFLTCAGFAADDSYDDDSARGWSFLKQSVGHYWGGTAEAEGATHYKGGSATYLTFLRQKFGEAGRWFQGASEIERYTVAGVVGASLGFIGASTIIGVAHTPTLLLVAPPAAIVVTAVVVDRFCLSRRV